MPVPWNPWSQQPTRGHHYWRPHHPVRCSWNGPNFNGFWSSAGSAGSFLSGGKRTTENILRLNTFEDLHLQKKSWAFKAQEPPKKISYLSGVKMCLPFWTTNAEKKNFRATRFPFQTPTIGPLNNYNATHEDKFQWWRLSFLPGVKGKSTGCGVFLLCFPFPKLLKNPRLEVHPRRKGWSSSSRLDASDLQSNLTSTYIGPTTIDDRKPKPGGTDFNSFLLQPKRPEDIWC